MKNPVLLVAAVALLAASAAQAADPEAGRAKSQTCVACHGADGNSVNPIWPSIAGQHSNYLEAQLRAYRAGERDDPLMTGMAAGLSDADIADLAAYYAAQKMEPKLADPALVELGERIYRGGNAERGVSACIACHGPRGLGNAPAGWPSIAGQHADYTAYELREYRSGDRTTDYQSMMRDIAKRMTDEEIAAVASYIQGLR